MVMKCKEYVYILVFLISACYIKAQDRDSSFFTLKANSVISTEFYTSFSDDSLWVPRLPPMVGRAILRGNAQLFSTIAIPFELYYSNRNFGTNQPFNQFGISPQITPWLTLHGGYFSNKVSEFTFGDLRILGGGIDIHPSNFRFFAGYGIIREARNQELRDSLLIFSGEYKRIMFAARAGYDESNGNYIYVNVLKAWDDSLSLSTQNSVLTPADNVVASLSGGVNIISGLYISGEFAASATNSNSNAKKIDNLNEIPSLFFIPTTTSFIDGAGKLSVVFNAFADWSVKTEAQWIGPGFTTQGFMQLPNDILDIIVSPTLRLLQGKMSLRGSLGVRYNNLRNNRLSATQRMIGTGGISWQIEDNAGFDASYSNYGIRSRHDNDTIRLQNIVQNISFSPYYRFEGWEGFHTLSGTFTLQNVDDNNIVTQRLTNSTATTIGLNHILSYVNTLNFTTSVFNTFVNNAALTISVLSISETAGYSFFDNVLDCSATLGISSVKTIESEFQMIARLSALYKTEQWGSFSVFANLNSYDYSSVSYNPSFRELQCNIQWTVNF